MHARWGERVAFVDVFIRQAHPGPGAPAYHDEAAKRADARRYQEDEAIPWPVLVDDLAGTTHQTYGTLADPSYLLDVDGRVAYYAMWTHAPNLNRAIQALFEQGGRGVVAGGIDHVIHLLPPWTDGWRGISRGLPQSFTDLETAMPGTASSLWLGHRLRPLLAPVTLRIDPLPLAARLAALAALVVVGLLARGRLPGRRG